MMTAIDRFLMRMSWKVRSFFVKEDGAAQIVTMVVLIAIAVVLAILFKDKIGELLGDLFNDISGKRSDIMSPPVTQ